MNDLISRRALLQDLSESIVITIREENSEKLRVYNRVVDRIEIATGVDAVPVVHGRWEWLGVDEFACSVCGRYVEYKSHNCGYAYCPNCGAKMINKKDVHKCP